MTNPFLNSFVEKIKSQKLSSNMAEWVENKTTYKGKQFSFVEHEFQREIVNDMHPNLVVKKPSQVGLTEVQIRKMIGFLKNHPGTNGIISYPTLNMRNNNSKSRIKPILERDFPTELKESRSVGMMQIDSSFLFIAANVEGDATSTPADIVMNDELDLADKEFISLVNSRLQHSDYKIRQSFSTPTFSGHGVSKEYDLSDKREFFYKCEHCGFWHVPKYDLGSIHIPGLPSIVEDLRKDISYQMAMELDLDNAYVKCPRCGKRISLDPDGREWVAEFPNRLNSRGYWVRPFSFRRLSVKYLVTELADYHKKGFLRRGVNTVLGEEYSDGQSRMEEDQIRLCLESRNVPEINKDKPVFIGIDIGIVCHITISDGINEFYLFERVNHEKLYQRVSELLSGYNIAGGAIDRYPQTVLSNSIRDLSGGKIMPVGYADRGKDVSEKRDSMNQIDYCDINRTEALDAVLVGVLRRNFKLNGYKDDDRTIVEHLRDMYRDDSPDELPRWVKMNGNDHYFHSMGYSLIARKITNLLSQFEEPSDARECVLLVGTDQTAKKAMDNSNLIGYSRLTNLNSLRGM